MAELEVLVRAAIFKPANELEGLLLQQAADRINAAYLPKPGEQAKGREALVVQGMFGAFSLTRRYYYLPGKKKGHFPADAALGLEGAYTPALARLICLEGGDEASFLQASLHLSGSWRPPGLRTPNPCALWAGWASTPCSGSKEKRPPAPAMPKSSASAPRPPECPCAGKPWLGAKEKPLTEKPKPAWPCSAASLPSTPKIRKAARCATTTPPPTSPASKALRTSASACAARPFGVAASRRRKPSCSSTGPPAWKGSGKDYFPDAVQIVDFYHALEHLQTLIETLWGKADPARNQRRRGHWKKLLAHDGIERIIKQARKEALLRGQVAEVEAALGYFLNNLSRMQYGSFRTKNYFIGSGVMEGLSHPGRKTLQAIRHVLGPEGRRKSPRLPLHSGQSQARPILEMPPQLTRRLE